MRPCRLALTLFFLPVAFGCLLGYAIGQSILVALEDARRERREAERDARHTAIDICRVPADYSFEVN